MNKRVLFTIAPMALLMGVITGCNNNNGNVQYAVTFDTDGGTLINPVIVKKGEKVNRPSETPVKDGYTFTDWYTTKDGNETFNFDATINKNTTVYAHYKALSEEEKFYASYKTASENFQKSEKGYDQYDITYTVGEEPVTDIEKVYYEVKDGIRKCSLKQIDSEDETILAGGENYKYYEDATKGIKAYIKSFIDFGYTITYNAESLYNTCSFTATNGETSISETFNSDGYLTKFKTSSGGVEFESTLSYSGSLHNPGKNVDAILEGETYTANASNLVRQDLVRVTIDATDENPFKVIECPEYEIGTYSFNDINVAGIYNNDFTKLKKDVNYSIKDGKISFVSSRKAKTIVDLKVARGDGIDSLTINATK